MQKKIASGEFDEAEIEVLRQRLIDAVEAMLGPLELLLEDVPGLSWLENKLVDMVLGDEVERARKVVAEMEIPFGERILENHCEKP